MITPLRSPDCDVRGLADSVFADIERETDVPEVQIDRLVATIREMPGTLGQLADHNARYRVLCWQLLVQERIVELCLRGAHARSRPADRSRKLREAVHAAVGTLRRIASAMTGRLFAPSGGLTMTSADDLLARVHRLEHAVVSARPGSLEGISATTEAAHLSLTCAEKGLGPRLKAFELAVAGYERAASRLLTASGSPERVFDPRLHTIDRFDELWSGHGIPPRAWPVFLRTLEHIASGLSRTWVETGRHGDARDAALLHLDVAERLGSEPTWLTAELQVAAADEQRDQVAAIVRLERVLTDERTTRLLMEGNKPIRLRIIDAIGRLALMLNIQGATAGRQHWVSTAQAWFEESTDAHTKAAARRIKDADLWEFPDSATGLGLASSRTGFVAPPNRSSQPDSTEDSVGLALFFACRDISAAVHAEHVPALVQSLTRLAARLLVHGNVIMRKDRSDRAAEIGQAIRQVDAWRPAGRGRHVSGPLPEQWLVDTNREALHLGELCWEFAEHYCPAAGLGALKTAARAAGRIFRDVGNEGHVGLWRELAARSQQLGDWQQKVDAEVLLAGISANSGQPREATLAARRAFQAMRAGFERLANLYEVTTLLDRAWAVYPARIARAFTFGDPQSWEAFSALDFGQGLALAAMRSAGSATLSELVALQHEEHELYTASAASAGSGASDLERLREVRAQIVELTRRGGSLLLEESGPGEQSWLLWELGADSAIVQFGKTKDDVVVSASRLVDGQPTYQTMELGKYVRVKGLMDRMWAVINADPTSPSGSDLPGRSALDEAYARLISPLRDFLAGTTTWYIVAHDELASLPVHAIRAPGGRFLVEDVAIGYAPSVKALGETRSAPTTAEPVLVIGSADQPVTGHEVTDLVRIIEDAEGGVVVADAGPSRLLDGTKSWRIIHIVAHGESLPFPHALESYLEFGSERITAREIMEHEVEAGLVFINACHLASSSPFGGDLYGFPFAFLASGTPVIAAAAPIYRPYASWFAQDLHRSLLAGESPLAAFTRTVRSFITEPWQRHPVYWAPYFYVGGPGLPG
jgi:hypothetical protein